MLAADERFLAAPHPDAEVAPIASPRFFRPGPGIAREDVDLLYSELQLLGLKLD